MRPLRRIIAARASKSTRLRITFGRHLIVLICGSVVLLGTFGIAGVSSSTRSFAAQTNSWTTFGGSSSRDSEQTVDAPSAPLHLAWTSTAQSGAIYGEPLIADHKVFAATESDTVEAISASTGRLLWTRSIGSPVPSNDLPCGDISPTVGVTSTMVIDPADSRLFVSGAILVGGAVQHELVAMSLSNGTMLFRRNLDQPGWNASAQLQRGALGLDDGRVLVGFGGNYGDCSSYHGYEMAVPESGKGVTLVYRVPTANEGAIWGPAGMAVSSNGHIYVATGNGSSRSNFDMGNAVIKLSSTLKEQSWFAPTNWASDSASDSDLGSTAPMLLPNQRLFEVGKEQTGYLLHAEHLGALGGSVQSISVCNARGSDAYYSGYLYLPCPDTGMVALRLVSGHLVNAWRTSSALGSPTVGAGLVWSVSGGKLLGLSRTTGHIVDTVAAPTTPHFATPSIADGLLIVGGDSEVVAYRG